MSKNNDCFELGILAGVVGGLVAGILFAPQKGEDSRMKVKNAIKNFNEQYGDEIESKKNLLSNKLDILKYNLERKLRILVNKSRAKKLKKAKELENECYFCSEMN